MDERGSFTVILYNGAKRKDTTRDAQLSEKDKALLQFLRVPRSRQEIVAFLGLNSATYAIRTYVDPLVEHGLIRLSIPEKPTSQKQRFMCAEEKQDFCL